MCIYPWTLKPHEIQTNGLACTCFIILTHGIQNIRIFTKPGCPLTGRCGVLRDFFVEKRYCDPGNHDIKCTRNRYAYFEIIWHDIGLRYTCIYIIFDNLKWSGYAPFAHMFLIHLFHISSICKVDYMVSSEITTYRRDASIFDLCFHI